MYNRGGLFSKRLLRIATRALVAALQPAQFPHLFFLSLFVVNRAFGFFILCYFCFSSGADGLRHQMAYFGTGHIYVGCVSHV